MLGHLTEFQTPKAVYEYFCTYLRHTIYCRKISNLYVLFVSTVTMGFNAIFFPKYMHGIKKICQHCKTEQQLVKNTTFFSMLEDLEQQSTCDFSQVSIIQ